MEVIGILIEKRKFVNRGFLIGPYCPIYGHGAILITILLHKYIDYPIALFIMGVVVCSIFDLTPNGIIEYLGLKEPIYTRTTNYGHFGKENLPWEKIIKI